MHDFYGAINELIMDKGSNMGMGSTRVWPTMGMGSTMAMKPTMGRGSTKGIGPPWIWVRHGHGVHQG